MIIQHVLTGSFKFETVFYLSPSSNARECPTGVHNTSRETIENMITNWDDVKRITETSIIWNHNVQWISQVYENLGYQMFPRREFLGQGYRPRDYELKHD